MLGLTTILAKIQLRLKRTRQDARRVRPFDVAKLKDCDFCDRYNVEIRNRFVILEEVEDLEAYWECLRIAMTASAEKAIGQRRGTFK